MHCLMNQNVATAGGYSITALAPFSRVQNPEHSFEASRDRILITLLALDLMLMAFFVVMNSVATVDAQRTAKAAAGMTAVEGAAPAATPVSAATLAPGPGTTARVAASAELRAAVADVFANFLPAGSEPVAAADDGRIDVDMPPVSGDDLPEAVRAGLAQVMENPPPGYRTELVIRASRDTAPARLAHMAQGLVDRGVTANALSVGTLTQGSSAAGSSAAGSSAAVRFTFLLLEPGEESRAAHADAGKVRP